MLKPPALSRNCCGILAGVMTLLLVAVLQSCTDGSPGPVTSMYQYRDTRNLVSFVWSAARSLQVEGEEGIQLFRRNRDDYRTGDYYLYVYDLDANVLFHAGMPYLEGRNMGNMEDHRGRNIQNMILEALADSGNPHGWVHYTWWEPDGFFPVPKSSCHFPVSTGRGEDIIVGGGMDYPHEEREFIRIIVDNAASRLHEEGLEALDLIADPASVYSYREVKVFVFTGDSILVSPVLGSSSVDLDLMTVSDTAGNRPFAMAVARLEGDSGVWQAFLVRNRYSRIPAKKVLYLRRVIVYPDTLYVGAVTDLPEAP